MAWATRWVATNFGGPEVLEAIEVGLPDPAPGQARIEVRAAGMNPADYKHFAPGQDPRLLPLTVGYEVAVVIAGDRRRHGDRVGWGARSATRWLPSRCPMAIPRRSTLRRRTCSRSPGR